VKRFTCCAARVGIASALLFGAAACGSDAATPATNSPGPTAPGTTAAPATTASPATTVPAPTHIVSLSPTATEMLFAIGAGSQVIAVDDQSNYPAEALAKPHTLSGFEPNVEAIAALHPDLVVMSDPKVQTQLEQLGVTVWIGAAAQSADDVYAQIGQLGAATGHASESAALVSSMQHEIADTLAATPKPAAELSVYHELDNTFYSVTSNTFIGKVYQLFGLKNIADGAQPGNDYPQLNAEYIVKANPDLVILADGTCCAQTAEVVGARPGWSAIKAVKGKSVIVIDDDIASRWGPRIVDLVQAVAAVVAKVPAA
jgi:iron complex transport system substrate-binding protein